MGTLRAAVHTFAFLLMLSVPLAKGYLSGTMHHLSRGSSISTRDDTTTILVSPNGAFSCGFYKVATNAFTFSVWFSAGTSEEGTKKTVAWTANRDTPVNGKGSRLAFRKDGSLALLDYGSTLVWSTNTAATRASRAELLNTGNLVVLDPDGQSLWRSFDSPTDTLLPLQPMTRNTKLVSASARGLLYSGLYTFYFDSNNVLTLIYKGPEVSSIYWPNPYYSPFDNLRTTYNSTQYGVLDQIGQFVASDELKIEASDLGHDRVMRRLTLDYDGNLRLYSLNENTGTWLVSWMALLETCDIHGLCGENSLCRYMPRLECSCVEGFEMNDPSDWSKGCRRKVNMTATLSQRGRRQQNANNTTTRDLSFRKFSQTNFYGYDVDSTQLVSLRDCKNTCLDNVNCQAFAYTQGGGACYPKVALFNGKIPFSYNDIYLKLPKAIDGLSSQTLLSPRPPPTHACKFTEKEAYPSSQMFQGATSKFKFGYFLSSVLTLLVIEVTLIFSGCWVVYKWERRPEVTDEGYMIISSQFRMFSYKELHKATNCFREEVGSGGSGAVYKGVLHDGRKVAVKKLNDVIQGDQEFRSELSVIGRIYHMNMVRIWGFCAEKTHKLLVSEFIENGSLDRVLFDHRSSSSPVLQWNQRYNIALGVAKGLAYLHHECVEWIVHCDVKPENILLDKDFEPKIADFGLVKLLKRESSTQVLSRVHGTRGYIAPEWALNLPISGKADVYSYGVVLLELVKGIRVSGWAVEGEEVEMTVRCSTEILRDKLASDDLSWLLEFVDYRLDGEFNPLQAAMMLKIAVSCVEEEMRNRPSMDHVVETLLSLME